MTSDSRSSRRYTDEEVRRLLKRASELESQGPALPAPNEGPTPAAVLGGSYLLARSIYCSFVHGRQKVLRRLMDDMVATVEDGVEEERRRLRDGS